MMDLTLLDAGWPYNLLAGTKKLPGMGLVPIFRDLRYYTVLEYS